MQGKLGNKKDRYTKLPEAKHSGAYPWFFNGRISEFALEVAMEEKRERDHKRELEAENLRKAKAPTWKPKGGRY